MKTVEPSRRFEFFGKGKDICKAVVKAHKIMPKGFVDVSTKAFLEKIDR